MSPEKTIEQLGLVLPELPTPGGNYIAAKTVGNLVYLSGIISRDKNGIITGIAGADSTVEEGYAAARACALSVLAVLRHHLGSLDEIRQIVSLNGYVNAVSGFPSAPLVINGASDLLLQVFGEAGRHVRTAIGVNALPETPWSNSR